jgi:dipeptidyl aminopeptidase/acylaminoacyl peptidase
LETGEERPRVITPADERRGVLSPDGSRLAFQRVEDARYGVYVTLVAGGAEVKVCDHCRSMLTWSPDGKSLIVSDGAPESLALLDVSTLRKTVIAERQGEYAVFDGVISPDGNWFAFDMLITPSLRPIFVANARGPKPLPKEKWVKAADGYFHSKPWWSPDGNLLYFYSRRDNFECIWAQRLDPVSKQPRGDAFAVQHFHDNLQTPNGAFIGYGATDRGLYLVLEESKGNIWLAEPQ